jgi:exopolyphosphatase / guanosine-5'-triphosphate,3'-diphosphate pyrophosphatase
MAHSGAVAAIDCGTNSTRLLIVDGSGTTMLREMRITRLGQGVDATHVLAPEALDRTLAVLRHYRSLMNAQDVQRSRLVATSAVRDATNGDEFLRLATKVIGTEAELLEGNEEGRLAYLGATADLPTSQGDNVVVDIGGGSTELVSEREGAIEAVSMNLGCVRLSERCFVHDPPVASEMADAIAVINGELDRAVGVIGALREPRPGSRLIGLAGTVSTLMALELGLVEYQRDQVHHAVLTRQAVDHWCVTLAAEPAQVRAQRPGMLEGRQDVIVGGALVLREVMSRFEFRECLVSESDILDGLAQSLQAG